MPGTPFERSVFINCPFDKDYDPILQALLFCLIFLGFHPRIARESADSAQVRLAKIQTLIESSRYSIHDLSRAVAKRRGETFRLNMPFELGMDYACRLYHGAGRETKRMLILGERQYDYQKALSDISGSDIEAHNGKFDVAVRKVRNWLVSEVGIEAPGTGRILQKYIDFQEWYFESQLAAGFTKEDILDYPTAELMTAMVTWRDSGQPISFD